MRHHVISALSATVAVSSIASATLVQVDIMGEWDFGMIRSGPLNGVNSGDAQLSFQVDSNVFVDSMNFPVRGYDIIQDSFTLTVDGITVGMPNPYPPGESPYFVLRDNDPAVDGFFLGTSIDGFPNGVAIDNAGLIDTRLRVIFEATYGGDRLPSLNILDAIGTYDFTGLSVFNWGFEDGGQQIAGMIFDQFTISVVPAPGVVALATPGIALAARRRRRP